jgi:hypothetical protein
LRHPSLRGPKSRDVFLLSIIVLFLGCGSRTGLDERGDVGGPLCTNDGACSDDLFCNGEERCVSGACVPGTAPSCDDGDPCSADVCDDTSDGCTHPPATPDVDGDGFVGALCGGNDCDDDDLDVHPGAAERCNEIDDDCDGEIDEAVGPVEVSPRVTNDGTFSHSTAWNGTEFAVAWHHSGGETPSLEVTTISATGEVIRRGSPDPTPSEDLITPALAWINGSFVCAWNRRNEDEDQYEIVLAVFDDELESSPRYTVDADDEVELLSARIASYEDRSEAAFDIALVHRLGDFGESPSQLVMSRVQLDESRNLVNTPRPQPFTDPEFDAYAPSIRFSDGVFAVAHLSDFGGEFGVQFLRIWNGEVFDRPLELSRSSWFPYSIALVEADDQLLVAWSELPYFTQGDMRFARLTLDGVPIAAEDSLTADHFGSVRPSLAWTGSELGIAWSHYPGGSISPSAAAIIRFATATREGELINFPITISEGYRRGIHPELLWTGDRFGLLYTVEEDDTEQLLFQQLCAPE